MRGPVWLRAGGMAMTGAAANALLGWWGVALVVGAFLVALGFSWEHRAALLASQQRELVWDGRAWQHQGARRRAR